MKIETIIKILKEYCDFSHPLTESNFENLITDELRAQRENLPYSFTFDHGISKLVLLIPHENFVIKIPFTGWYEEDDYDYAYCEWEDAEKEDNRGPEPVLEDFYCPFEFANTPYITLPRADDYCALEVAIYEDAIEEGVAQYLAKEWKVDQIDEISIYAQERAKMLDDDKFDATASEKTCKRCEQLSLRCFNSMWIADFFEIYGEDEFVKLSKFLEKHRIHDLHAGNLGYIDNMPVIVDYSCYREW